MMFKLYQDSLFISAIYNHKHVAFLLAITLNILVQSECEIPCCIAEGLPGKSSGRHQWQNVLFTTTFLQEGVLNVCVNHEVTKMPPTPI